jgi:hypothetical protein
MSQQAPVVFIGSGEASALERKVLIHSIRKNTRGPVDIRVFNGTHNALERDGHPPAPLPMSLPAKYLNITEFSNYRFLIPQLCDHRGRAIYLDSDMVCLGDLNELFNAPMDGAQFLAKAEQDLAGKPRWGLSVMLFDCENCRFDLDTYVDDIAHKRYGYGDLHTMSGTFLAQHPFRIGRIDPRWNEYDHCAADTRLVHYTNLFSQPWKYRGHRHGGLWFDHLAQAMAQGVVTAKDVELATRRGYARPDIGKGNAIGVADILRNMLSDLKAAARRA